MYFFWNVFGAPETTQARTESEDTPVYVDFENVDQSGGCVVA
jgi:hypothetical protein